MHPPTPLDAPGRERLADALGDTPWTVISVHALRRGVCRAYADGDPAAFRAAIVQWDDQADEPTVFGEDVAAIWRLLAPLDGWRVVNVDEAIAEPLGRLMERALGRRVRYYSDLYHILSEAPSEHRHPLVRSLTPADTDLLAAAPRSIQGAGFGGPAGLLRDGIAAGAVDGGRLIAIAHTSAITARFADVGVATLAPYRGQGISTAAAALVCRAIRLSGRTPVWSCGEDNHASRRVAEKLGFTPIGRRIYVIPAEED